MKAKTKTMSLSLLVALLFTVLPVPAVSNGSVSASESEVISAVNMLTEIAPELVQETALDTSTVQVEFLDEQPVVSVDNLEDSNVAATGVEFTLDYADELLGEHGGITAFESEDSPVQALVQPTDVGVRVLTVIEDASAPTRYDYTFNVPEGTQLEDAGDVFYLIGDDLYGSLLPPWAVDAVGNSVPTSYSWKGNTLTQHVDLSSVNIVYPVVADPAWSYAYKFPTGKKTAANARTLLKKCFNCYFPVTGAPKAFPTVGQTLPLKGTIAGIGALNMECKFASENYDNQFRWIGFRFNATKNHIDKSGSWISFTFKSVNKENHLLVSAHIVNDMFAKGIYRAHAIQMWTKFANNIKNG